MLLFGNDNFFFKFFQGLINFEEENLWTRRGKDWSAYRIE